MNKITAVWAVSTLRKTAGTEVKNILTAVVVYGNLIPNVIDSAALLTYLKRTLEPHRVSAYATLYCPKLDPVDNISANQG